VRRHQEKKEAKDSGYQRTGEGRSKGTRYEAPVKARQHPFVKKSEKTGREWSLLELELADGRTRKKTYMEELIRRKIIKWAFGVA